MASVDSNPVRVLREGPWTPAGGRVAAILERVPLALAVLLIAGVVLRLAISVVYQPAVFNNPDSAAYITMANGGLFADPVRPAGYSFFLIGLNAISDQLAFTIAVQHLLGIATALMLYAIGRRAGAPVWAAAAGAAAVLLSLDQVVLEHMILAETLFTALLVAALYASVRALDDPRPLWGPADSRHAWIATAALLLGSAATVRAVAAPLAAFFLLWILFAIPGRWLRRGANAVLACVTIAVVLLTYFAFNEDRTGHFGLTQSPGWAIYSRAAPFADCAQFEPPAGTEALCESTPASSRNGPDFYGWEAGSPATQMFKGPPTGNEELGEFGRRAIMAQPTAYVRAVGIDVVRYFVPNFRSYAFGGPGYDALDVQRDTPALEREVWGWHATFFEGVDMRRLDEGVAGLSEVQDWVRVQPLLMLAAAIAAIAGIVFTRGRVRAILILLFGAGLLLVTIPSLSANYSARYAIPAGGPLVLAGAIGVWAMIDRRSRRAAAGAAASGRT